jgi:hypothetical protein
VQDRPTNIWNRFKLADANRFKILDAFVAPVRDATQEGTSVYATALHSKAGHAGGSLKGTVT